MKIFYIAQFGRALARGVFGSIPNAETNNLENILEKKLEKN